MTHFSSRINKWAQFNFIIRHSLLSEWRNFRLLFCHAKSSNFRSPPGCHWLAWSSTVSITVSQSVQREAPAWVRPRRNRKKKKKREKKKKKKSQQIIKLFRAAVWVRASCLKCTINEVMLLLDTTQSSALSFSILFTHVSVYLCGEKHQAHRGPMQTYKIQQTTICPLGGATGFQWGMTRLRTMLQTCQTCHFLITDQPGCSLWVMV